MTDQLLRDTLTRMADGADPAAPDPAVLWDRARRARRRADALTTAAVGLAVFALVAAVGLLGSADPSRPEPAPVPPGPPGIPSVVRGVDGDGGLDVEDDLAVGRASVAIANPSGAFVVTAADGEYHRLALPGYDPRAYDDPEVRATGMVGVHLSPDGRTLVYGWHAPLPAETGQQRGLVRSGVRLVDLVSGEVETLADLGPVHRELDFLQRANGFPYLAVPFGFRWSEGGRFLAYETVWLDATVDLRRAYEFGPYQSVGSVYDTGRRERFGVNENGQGVGWTEWPQMVSPNGLVGAGGFVFAERDTRRRLRELPGEGWTSGLFASGGRALLEQAGARPRLAEVALRSGTVQFLRVDTGAPVDLLGWIGRDRALAVAGVTDLVVLDLADEAVESTVVGRVAAGETASTFSFATDYATPRHPTRDFTESPPPSPEAPPPDSAGPASGLDRDWLLAGLATGLLVAGLVAVALRRRIRVAR